MRRELYTREQKLASSVRRLSSLSAGNRQAILDFKTHCESRNLSVGRTQKYVSQLYHLAHMLGKDFADADRKDIERMMAAINTSRYCRVCLGDCREPGMHKTGYAELTKLDYCVALKVFYNWLRECQPKTYPPEVSWLSTTGKKATERKPEEILTEAEALSLVSHAECERDRALVMSLWDSGFRIGELLNTRIKDWEFNGDGVKVSVDGKTGQRTVFLIPCAIEMARWLDRHPLKADPNAFVFLCTGKHNHNRPLGHQRASVILQRLADKAGVKKKVNPHAFRHARATWAARRMTEQEMKVFFGWVRSSDQCATYVHLCAKDIEGKMRSLYGLQPVEVTSTVNGLPVSCPRCGGKNVFDAMQCGECALPLTIVAVPKEVIQTKAWCGAVTG
jgi:integrase